MKICAVICEFDPFHNGHKYLLERARKESGCDKVLCLMSGNFTQRGEIAVLNKYPRARHAVENGADIVLELPAAFAVAPAEVFASGAVALLSSIPAVEKLAFGCESGKKEDFLRAAAPTEDETFRNLLKKKLKEGESYVKARSETVIKLHPELDKSLFLSPNNILGLEYCRAIFSRNSKIEPLPILRKGGGYADRELHENFSSASAIRAAIGSPSHHLIKKNVPEDVFQDLSLVRPNQAKTAILCALLSAGREKIAKTTDCSEGLENKLFDLAQKETDYDKLLEEAVSKRYTLSRIKRILMQNFLGIYRGDVKRFLFSPLYLKVLALKKEGRRELLSALGEASFPLVARKSDFEKLSSEAAECFQIDLRANGLFNILNNRFINPFETVIL